MLRDRIRMCLRAAIADDVRARGRLHSFAKLQQEQLCRPFQSRGHMHAKEIGRCAGQQSAHGASGKWHNLSIRREGKPAVANVREGRRVGAARVPSLPARAFPRTPPGCAAPVDTVGGDAGHNKARGFLVWATLWVAWLRAPSTFHHTLTYDVPFRAWLGVGRLELD